MPYLPKGKLGVVLMNLGTPVEPNAPAVRRFLAEFLGDRRVVELPRLIWWPILYGIILPFRAPKVARLYQQVWQPEGSPLKVITEKQVSALQSRFGSDDVLVTYAMTYGEPKLEQRISELEVQGADRILVLPLYPQYSATTTAAIYDQYADLISRQRDISNVFIHKYYFDRDDYISALAESIQSHWNEAKKSKGAQPADKLLFSFHGIPKLCVERGDPYEKHCRLTAEKVAERLNLDKTRWEISFQSRLGKAEWLQPYTDLLLKQWAEEGVESVEVICPAFSVDCLETLEEIDGENREIFLSSGGQRFEYIVCLNDSPQHIDMMENIVNQYRSEH